MLPWLQEEKGYDVPELQPLNTPNTYSETTNNNMAAAPTSGVPDEPATLQLDNSDTANQDKPGRDEVDRASLFSLYMERDFRYFFQHPFARIIVAYLVTFCNFLIYAEDPVAHSEQECFIPVIGNCFSFVCTKYPDNGWAALKVILWVIGILVGLIVGKLVVHQILFSKWSDVKENVERVTSAIIIYLKNLAVLYH